MNNPIRLVVMAALSCGIVSTAMAQDVCERHGLHKVWTANHKSWRCSGPRREPSYAHNLKVAAEVDVEAKTTREPRSRRHHLKLEDRVRERPTASVPAPTVSALERPAPIAPAAEIAFPTMKRAEGMAQPATLPQPVPWFSPYPMTGWPEIYDFDQPHDFKPWQNRIQ